MLSHWHQAGIWPLVAAEAEGEWILPFHGCLQLATACKSKWFNDSCWQAGKDDFRFELPTSLLAAPPADPTRQWPRELHNAKPRGAASSASGAAAQSRIPLWHRGIQQWNRGCASTPGEFKPLLFMQSLSAATASTPRVSLSRTAPQ